MAMSSVAIKPEPEQLSELEAERLEEHQAKHQAEEKQPEESESDSFRGWPSQLKLPLRDLNPILTCPLCAGYIINATRIIDCFHVFCKSCIITHLGRTRACPQCDIPVSEPWLSLRTDKDFQRMVFKLVPGLEANEAMREREFGETRERRGAEEEAEEEEEQEEPVTETDEASAVEEAVEKEDSAEEEVVEEEEDKAEEEHEAQEEEEELDVEATSEPEEEKMKMEVKEEEEDFPVVLCLEPQCPFLKNPTAFYAATSVRHDVFLLPLAQKFVRCSAHLTLRHVAAGLRKALRTPPDVSITFVRNRAHVTLSTRLAELTRPRGAAPLLLKYRGLRRLKGKP